MDELIQTLTQTHTDTQNPTKTHTADVIKTYVHSSVMVINVEGVYCIHIKCM